MPTTTMRQNGRARSERNGSAPKVSSLDRLRELRSGQFRYATTFAENALAIIDGEKSIATRRQLITLLFAEAVELGTRRLVDERRTNAADHYDSLHERFKRELVPAVKSAVSKNLEPSEFASELWKLVTGKKLERVVRLAILFLNVRPHQPYVKLPDDVHEALRMPHDQVESVLKAAMATHAGSATVRAFIRTLGAGSNVDNCNVALALQRLFEHAGSSDERLALMSLLYGSRIVSLDLIRV